MDIREKIGQRLVFGFPGTTIPAEFAALVREYKIGNVILFRYNIESLLQLARRRREFQSRARSRRKLQPHEPRDRCTQLRRRSAERRALRHKGRGGL